MGNGDPMHGVCIPHRISRVCEQQTQKNGKRVVRNLEERSVGTIKGKSPEQDLY